MGTVRREYDMVFNYRQAGISVVIIPISSLSSPRCLFPGRVSRQRGRVLIPTKTGGT